MLKTSGWLMRVRIPVEVIEYAAFDFPYYSSGGFTTKHFHTIMKIKDVNRF